MPAGLSASRLVDLFELATQEELLARWTRTARTSLLRQVRATNRSDDACAVYVLRF